ncbi:choline-glycine betaine transporter [Salibacterium salarium]|uniref:hypothetical protein n=1 Tax=Salibacterium salarium TaxID=284579 RepID=UPI0027869656|nr:hypothetical protein [Salibacterium salarium]MDQ0298887.1 choline-glycine betaine transporter [Salibacterium salarium]
MKIYWYILLGVSVFILTPLLILDMVQTKTFNLKFPLMIIVLITVYQSIFKKKDKDNENNVQNDKQSSGNE